MHNLIQRIFNKKNIKDINELSEEEKATYKSWDAILSKDELNLEDIKNFCQSQISIIETKWHDFKIQEESKAKLLPYYTVYKTLLKVVDSPKSQRESLEKYLVQLIEQ